MKIRLANKADLETLKQMFLSIVENMYKNGIFIWNEYYPFEEFEKDIDSKQLYVLIENNTIVSAFCLLNNIQGESNFNWQEKQAKSIYIARLGVNTDYTRKGIATKTLEYAKQLCKQLKAKFLRLTVVEENIPAINLYLKNGFTKVEGLYQEYSECLNKTINEIGFEIKLS